MKGIAILIVIAVAFTGYLWSGAFSAPMQTAGEDAISPDTVDGDVLRAGRNLNVQTEIEGDLAIAGASVTVTEPVDGYVMAAGSEVQINAPVGNDLWAAGRRVSVSAPVADSVRLAGNSVVLEPEASVGGDAYVAGNTVEIRGPVMKDLKIGAAQATLASEVGGSVHAGAASLKVLPGAIVHGDLVVRGPRPPEIAPEAQVLGQVVHRREEPRGGWSFPGWLAWWGFLFLAILVLGVAALAFSGRWTDRVAGEMAHHFGYSLLAGIIGVFVIPLICLVLAVTIIGIPLAIVLLALYGVALILSGAFVSYLVGAWLFRRRAQTSPYTKMAVGALVVALLCSLPWIGWFVQILVLLVGFGGLILERKDTWQGHPAESFA